MDVKIKLFVLMLTALATITVSITTFFATEQAAEQVGERAESYTQQRVICDYVLNDLNSSLEPGETAEVPLRCFEDGQSLTDELEDEDRGKMMSKTEEGLYLDGRRIR